MIIYDDFGGANHAGFTVPKSWDWGATESWDFEIENAVAIPGLQSI